VHSPTERAALALTDNVTLVADGHVRSAVDVAAREGSDPSAYAALVFTIVTVNARNRLAITCHAAPGRRHRPQASATST
jgi:alkylhydroperoxidase family enzyme